jgi:hypothetical protein
MDSKTTGITLVNLKAKESELAKPIALVLEQLELPAEWIDAKGRVMKSAVLVSGEAGIVPKDGALSSVQLTSVQNNALRAFFKAAPEHGLLDADGKFAGLHVDSWRDEVYRTSTADSPGAKKKSFQRVRTDLVERGQISVDDDIYRLSSIQRVMEAGFAIALREKHTKTMNPDDYRDMGHERDIDGTCPCVASP